MRRLPAALAASAVRRLTIAVAGTGSYDDLPVEAPTPASLDRSLLLMPHLEEVTFLSAVSAEARQHVAARAPRLLVTYYR